MTHEKTADPLGAGYWRTLTDVQRRLLAALTDEYQPLRTVLSRAEANAYKVGSQVTWEKLAVIRALDVDLRRRDDVYVRRGETWQKLWDRVGLQVTHQENAITELKDQLAAEIDSLIESSELGNTTPEK